MASYTNSTTPLGGGKNDTIIEHVSILKPLALKAL